MRVNLHIVICPRTVRSVNTRINEAVVSMLKQWYTIEYSSNMIRKSCLLYSNSENHIQLKMRTRVGRGYSKGCRSAM